MKRDWRLVRQNVWISHGKVEDISFKGDNGCAVFLAKLCGSDDVKVYCHSDIIKFDAEAFQILSELQIRGTPQAYTYDTVLYPGNSFVGSSRLSSFYSCFILPNTSIEKLLQDGPYKSVVHGALVNYAIDALEGISSEALQQVIIHRKALDNRRGPR